MEASLAWSTSLGPWFVLQGQGEALKCPLPPFFLLSYRKRREEPLGPGRQRMKSPLRKKKAKDGTGTALTSPWSVLLGVPLRSLQEPSLFSARPVVSLPAWGVLRPAHKFASLIPGFPLRRQR